MPRLGAVRAVLALLAVMAGSLVLVGGPALNLSAPGTHVVRVQEYTYDTASQDASERASLLAAIQRRVSLSAGRRVVGAADLSVSTGAGVAAEGADAAGAGGGRVVIGKVGDLTADGAIGPGERTLLDQLPDLGPPRANWGQNSGVLRRAMSRGLPIRDASVTRTGELRDDTGFLRAERYLLQDRGWTYDPKLTWWLPPGW